MADAKTIDQLTQASTINQTDLLVVLNTNLPDAQKATVSQILQTQQPSTISGSINANVIVTDSSNGGFLKATKVQYNEVVSGYAQFGVEASATNQAYITLDYSTGNSTINSNIIKVDGPTNSVTINNVSGTTADYNLTLPSQQGQGNLVNDGNGNLSWSSPTPVGTTPIPLTGYYNNLDYKTNNFKFYQDSTNAYIGMYRDDGTQNAYISTNKTQNSSSITANQYDVNYTSVGSGSWMRWFASNSNYVTLNAPASITASYNLKFPNALPSSNSSLLCNTSGELSFGFPTARFVSYTSPTASPVSLPNATNTVISQNLTYNAGVLSDTGLTYNSASGLFSNNTGGNITLQISSVAYWGPNSSGARSIWINRGNPGTTIGGDRWGQVDAQANTSDFTVQNLFTIMTLSSSQSFTLVGWQNSSTTITTGGTGAGASTGNQLSIVRLS